MCTPTAASSLKGCWRLLGVPPRKLIITYNYNMITQTSYFSLQICSAVQSCSWPSEIWFQLDFWIGGLFATYQEDAHPIIFQDDPVKFTSCSQIWAQCGFMFLWHFQSFSWHESKLWVILYLCTSDMVNYTLDKRWNETCRWQTKSFQNIDNSFPMLRVW